jgi:hypothetical protein
VSEHLTVQHIEAYRAEKLSGDALPFVYGHIAVCETCRIQLGDAPKLRASLDNWKNDFAIEPPVHIAYEQLTAYVDKKIDSVEREIIESHIKICVQCSQEALDLLAFSTEFKSEEVNESPANLLTVSVPAKQTITPVFWQKLIAFWQLPGYRIALQLAGTAAAMVICVWLATQALRTENNRLKTELGKLQQNNEMLQQQYEATNSAIDNLQTQLNDLQQTAIQNLKPESGNSLLASFKDGDGQITLDTAGNLTGLKMLPPVYQQMIKTALVSERIQTPATVATLIDRVGTLRSGTSQGVAFALFSPVGTNVLTERPTFRWSTVKGATHYLVAVYDENFNWVATSQPLTITTWTVPNTLKRGATYVWQVSAMMDGKEIKSPVPPASDAKFRVIEQTKAEELSQLKKSAANSHLAIGLIYAREGLLDDAEREFEALMQSNSKSAVTRKLFNQVKALRGAK